MTRAQSILKGDSPFRQAPRVAQGIMLGEKRRGFFSVVEPVERSTNYIKNCAFMAGRHPYNRLRTATARSITHEYTLINGVADTSVVPECYPMYGGWIRIVPEVFPNIVIESAGTSGVVGTYIHDGTSFGRPMYVKGNYSIRWTGDHWSIMNATLGQIYYTSSNNVDVPNKITTWQLGANGALPLPSQDLLWDGKCGIYQEVTLKAGQYTFSAFFAGDRARVFEVYVTDSDDNIISGRKKMRGNNNWQRPHITFEAKEDGNYRMYLVKEYSEPKYYVIPVEANDTDETYIHSNKYYGHNYWNIGYWNYMPLEGEVVVVDDPSFYAHEVFYTSFWVCEDNPFLTLPFNGAYEEKNTTFTREYEWSKDEVEWLGISSRSGLAVNSGRERFLRDYNFVLTEIIGLGSSGMKHITRSLASSGSVWNTTRVDSREFVLRGQIYAESFEERTRLEGELDSVLTSTARRSLEQPMTLLFRVYNEENNAVIEGQTIYIYCRYNGGIANTIPNENGAYDVSLSFVLVDPFIYSSMHRSQVLDDRITFTSRFHHTVITKDEEGNFEQVNINAVGRIRKIVRGADGSVYIGGHFGSVNNVANTKYLARFNEETKNIVSVATFTETSGASDSFVSDIVPLADGRIIVCGSFASVNSVSNTHNIAIYNPSTETWAALGGGCPDDRLMFNSIGIDQLKNIYGTGQQDEGAQNLIYKFSISENEWSVMGVLNEGDGIPDTLVSGQKILVVNRKVDPDFVSADLYVTGRFASVGEIGYPVNNTRGMAKYNGGSVRTDTGSGPGVYQKIGWEAMPDEIVSLVTQDLITQDVEKIVTQDGKRIVVMAEGGFVEDMAVGTDGKIYMVGNFIETTSGLRSPYVIRYNGTQFEAIGLPGAYARFCFGAKRIAIDRFGKVHILLDFSFTDIIPLAKDYLVLSGNTWASGGLYTDPTGARVISDGTIYWDDAKSKIWLATRPYSGKVTFGGDLVKLENNGERVYPKFTFVGGGQLIAVSNKATKKHIDFSGYTLQNSEIVELNLEKHGIEIIKLVSSVNGNISRMIAPSSNIGFELVRGENSVGHIFYNAIADATCVATWRERYLGIYNASRFKKII